jgi:sugar lactone lactonase YvrE
LEFDADNSGPWSDSPLSIAIGNLHTATMKQFTAQLAFPTRCTLGEGPVWHDDRLWLVDIEGKCLIRTSPASSPPSFDRFDTGQRVGFAVPTARGDWIVGLQNGFARLTPGQSPVVFASPESRADIRLNDGKVAPDGFLLAGSMQLQCESGAASLYSVAPDLTVTRLLTGITISNGLAWARGSRFGARGSGGNAVASDPSPESRTPTPDLLFYIDTPTRRIDAFDYHAGAISNRRTIFQMNDLPGGPDGMCIDSAGRLWVATWGGWSVLCIDPTSGTVVAKVSVPASNVTSCCFGGPDLGTLYITTARVGLNEQSLRDQPEAGSVFMAHVDAIGLKTELFRG